MKLNRNRPSASPFFRRTWTGGSTDAIGPVMRRARELRVTPRARRQDRHSRSLDLDNDPAIDIGLGAQILGLAADGRAVAHPFEFRVERGRRTRPDALNGFLPESFPIIP